jgi:catechol 2,3-dioxygenase-like lactoylglutathione lyase family enzyme
VTTVTLLSATPALPVSDIARAVDYYEGKLGFRRRHVEDDYAILTRDEVEIHLWAANKPNVPGAGPELAGTASCRILVSGVKDLYKECQDANVVHPNGWLAAQPWGTEEFTALDADRNAITFFEAKQ